MSNRKTGKRKGRGKSRRISLKFGGILLLVLAAWGTAGVWYAHHPRAWLSARPVALSNVLLAIGNPLSDLTDALDWTGHDAIYEYDTEAPAGEVLFAGAPVRVAPPAPGDIRILKRADIDPFSVPDLTDEDEPHRRKTHGTVLAVTCDRFFLRVKDGTFLCVRPIHTEEMPSVGSTVTVVGFAESDLTIRQLAEALWQNDPSTTPAAETTRMVTADDLFLREGPSRKANFSLYGQLIRLTGRITALSDPWDAVAGFRMDLDGIPITVNLSGLDRAQLPELGIGSVLDVTGICTADFSRSDSAIVFPSFRGFIVIPTQADDVRLVHAPPWWTVRRLVIVLILLAILLGVFAGWTAVLRRRAARQAHELVRKRLAETRAKLKVEERTRLAVELHDSLSQTLTGVALQISAAMKSDGERARGLLNTASQMLGSCRQELRGCLFDLRTQTFAETGLTSAISHALTQHLGGAQLRVRFNVARKFLPETTVHAILRIIRELTMNAVSHGGAKNVRIAGERRDGLIRFVVADDGCGFDPSAVPGPSQGHFGLQGVRERLRTLNGTISFESHPGRGTRATVTIVEPNTEEA